MTGRSTTRGDALAQRLCSGPVAGLFETDTGSAEDWVLAAALCARCPVLAACRDELCRAFPGWGAGRRRANPSAVVWAGAIFSPERRLWTRHGLTRASAARAARSHRQSPPSASPGRAPLPATSAPDAHPRGGTR